MRDSSFLIREIKPQDNAEIEKIIRSAFHEFQLPLTGSTYEDPEIPCMFESYQNADDIYYILEQDGKVVGGAGIKSLTGETRKICELQKMYFVQSVRGLGYGRIMLNKCLQAAAELGYSHCYLESASALKQAIALYEKNGFEILDKPMGNTGHVACGVWMLKEL